MIIVLIAFLGLLFGSFFNVLIWRIPRNESIVFPASHCPNCNRKIKSWENIPVFSYLFLRGKCAGCKSTISIAYPLVELLTAGLAVVLWYTVIPHHTITWQAGIPLFLQLLFLILMIPVAVIDLRHYIIPDSITLSLLVLSFGISFIPGGFSPLQSILGILAGGGVLWAMGFIGTIIFKKGDAMGGGDIKLMAAAGALWGPEIALMGIVFGAFLGSLSGIPLILFKKLKADHHIPFGPFLGAGLWVAVIAGYFLFTSYVGLIDGIFKK
jgi:leader peptidase (prepilin peptidase)/N-methyltransferase